MMNITTRTHAFINSTATTTVAASVAADTYTDVQMVFIYVAMVLLSAFTVIGNIAVFVAYFRTPDLQNSTNYFILSLATADVVIGLISVNFYTVYLAYGYWPLNEVLCDFWLCADYWCCQASVLNLVVISVDRLFSIKYPVAYRSRRSDAIVKKVIVVIWIFAFLLWVPWIISYQFIQGERTVPVDSCYIQFLYESWYITIITACFGYYGPILLISIVYINIYRLLLQRKRKVGAITGAGSIRDKSYNSVTAVTDLKTEQSVTECNTSNFEATKHTENESTVSKGYSVRSKNGSVVNQKRRGLSDHERAATLLVLIILAYAITWLPYDLFAVIAPFCDTCISADWWHFGYIFCYANSLINPICYAFGNKKFKRAFKQILCCRKT